MPGLEELQKTLRRDVGLAIGGVDVRDLLGSAVGEVARVETRLDAAKTTLAAEIGEAHADLSGRIDTANNNFNLYQSLMTARTEELTRALDEQGAANAQQLEELDAQTTRALAETNVRWREALDTQRSSFEAQLHAQQAATQRQLAEVTAALAAVDVRQRHQTTAVLRRSTEQLLRSVFYRKLDRWRALQKSRVLRLLAQRQALKKLLRRHEVTVLRDRFHLLILHARAHRAERVRYERTKALAFRVYLREEPCHAASGLESVLGIRIHQLHRERALRALLPRTRAAHLRRVYAYFIGHAAQRRARRAARDVALSAKLAQVTSLGSRARLQAAFTLWQRHRHRRHQLAARVRATEQYALKYTEACKQKVWDRWALVHRRWRRVQQAKATSVPGMAAAAARALYGVYYERWMRQYRGGRAVKAKMERVRAVAAAADERLKDRFWGLWVQRQAAERRRAHRAAEVVRIAKEAQAPLKDTYFQRWGAYLTKTKAAEARARRVKAAAASLEYLVRRSGDGVRRVYWGTWRRWVAALRDGRQAERQAEYLTSLQQKSDALWAQLELHQKTVANTNSCVHRLVDKLIVVDESLDKLEKSKAGRRELSSVVESVAAAKEQFPAVGAPPGVDGGGDPSFFRDLAFLPPPPPPPRVGDDDVAAAQESAMRLSAILNQTGGGGGGSPQRRDTLPVVTSTLRRGQGGGRLGP